MADDTLRAAADRVCVSLDMFGSITAGDPAAQDLRAALRAALAAAKTPGPSDGLRAIDGCIAIVQQSLDSVRAEDDGESKVIKMSIAAREHVLWLLNGYRSKWEHPDGR